MVGDLMDEWSDCDGDGDRLEWAASYLARKGFIQNRRPVGSGRPSGSREEALGWIREAARSSFKREDMERMDHAWSQRKSVRGKKNKGKVSLSCFIDRKAKERLENYAAKNDLEISEALELVLSRVEIKQGEQLAAAKKKLETLQGKVARYSRALERSTQELAERTVIMQHNNLLASRLDETQKTLSLNLSRKLFKDLFNGSELAAIDFLLQRKMDRP